jgi:hypothetical protein
MRLQRARWRRDAAAATNRAMKVAMAYMVGSVDQL